MRVKVSDRELGQMVTIEAEACGVKGLCVHPVYRAEDEGWNVTHVKSGRFLDLTPFSPFPDKRDAVRAAKAIADTTDWTQPAEDLFCFAHIWYVYRALEKEFGDRW